MYKLRFTIVELKRMIEEIEKHDTTLIDVKYTDGSIGAVISAKAVKKDAEYVMISDVDSW